MPETETTPTATVPQVTKPRTRTTRTAKAKPKTKVAPKRKASTNRWTDTLKAKCRRQIKAGTSTYVSIAKDLKVTPQTVWAALNRAK